MTDNLEYIDNYFKKELTPEQSGQFEQRITNDPAFAEEVAFYLSAKEALQGQLSAEKKERFRAIYSKRETPVVRINPLRRLWPYVAAVAVTIALIFRFVFFNAAVSPLKLADEYIQEHLTQLSPSMSVIDSMEMGKILYNEKKYTEALILFETILDNDSSKWEAKQYAGIVSLRSEQYDKAIQYFTQLENTRLEKNPGKFYHALTLMKRNLPDDAQEAKKILDEVVKEGLYGKDIAADWLARF